MGVTKTEIAEFYKNLLDSLSDGVYFVDKERRITYWNKAAEEMTGRESAEVLGSRCSEHILDHTDEKGRLLCAEGCPLAATLEDGLPRQAAAYMLHKTGHRVPVNIRAMPVYDSEGKIIGGAETFSDSSPAGDLNARLVELEKLALIDELTGAGNRRFADITLKTRINELKRHSWSFGVILSDIDNFKPINDTYGHNVGDEVLQMVSRTIATNIRNGYSFLFRWGGDEFLILATGVNHQNLLDMAERIRVLVAHSALPREDEAIQVTISAGATLASPEDTVEGIIRRADRLLYLSKKGGHNRITSDPL